VIFCVKCSSNCESVDSFSGADFSKASEAECQHPDPDTALYRCCSPIGPQLQPSDTAQKTNLTQISC
jgi:hypothetical protein